MQNTKLDYQMWALAFYILNLGIKRASSKKIHRDLDITQKTAWYLAMRIREAWRDDLRQFVGPIEVDELYFGGKEKNKYEHKKLKRRRGITGKAAVVGTKGRETGQVQARVVADATAKTLTGFVFSTSREEAQTYTDDAKAYQALKRAAHAIVKRSVKKYFDGEAHPNGMGSSWSLLKRGYCGTYHRMSPKHLQRYVNESVRRHKIRRLDMVDQLESIARGLFDKQITFKILARKTKLDYTAV